MALAKIVSDLGRFLIQVLVSTGKISIFSGQALSYIFRPPFYLREIISNIFNIGYLSMPVVGLTATFTGAALALQIYSGGSRFNATEVVPQIVAIGMVRELGPVLVGLMIAARVTSSIAAELATMKVTEQIDALITLSTNPMKYLVMPRVLAGIITGPILVLVADSLGVFGGFLVSTQSLGFNPNSYILSTMHFLTAADILSSLVKGASFGLKATLMGCYFGLNSNHGAQGVGSATKSSVQAAAVLILAINFLLTALLFTA
jgi:phospholipid/cholesterol/gamma-HCH transport system permease protein